MAIFCRISNLGSDIRCRVCGQGVLVFWSRVAAPERAAIASLVIEALTTQHVASASASAHSSLPFGLFLPEAQPTPASLEEDPESAFAG